MKPFELIKPYFREQRLKILIGLFCLIIVDLLQLWIPRIIKRVVDDLTFLRGDFGQLMVYGAYITGIAIVIGILRYIWRRCLIGSSRRIEEGLRNQLFSKILTFSASYFDRHKTGDLMAHATNDIMHIRMAAGMGLVALNDAILMGGAAIGFMLYINVRLTLYVLIPMPLIVLGTRFFSKRMHTHYKTVQAGFADLTEAVRERIAGIRVIKTYNMEKHATHQIERLSRDYIAANMRLVKITGAFFPLIMMLTNFSMAIVVYLGGRQTIFTVITPGDFVAFISYLGLLTWPMMAMGWVINLIQRGRASLERVGVILETPAAICDPSDPKQVGTVAGEIGFNQVNFNYPSAARPILTDFSHVIKAGQSLGLTGPPGCGKTTLLNLIPRLYDVSSGAITIDGTDIRQMKLEDLRRQLTFLPQEPFLFEGTIRDNLTLGKQDISEEKLIEGLRRAAFDDAVDQFPRGLETLIGEKGVILSGGQKQRLALARALLKPAPIIILDDPISQVDVTTGSRIIDTIRLAADQQTLLIASHRLSAIRFADYIIVLDQGTVLEAGDHRQLMQQDGYYARTFRLQEIESELAA